MNRWPTLAAFVGWTALVAWCGWEWRDRSADLAESQQATAVAQGEAHAQAGAREAEHKQAAAIQSAADSADTREEKIDADYQERLAAAIAGRDSELGRLRKLWGQCETQRLSDPAAAAAAVSEEDRLRRASAARVVRAVELAQSERDEVIDRYEAVRAASTAELQE